MCQKDSLMKAKFDRYNLCILYNIKGDLNRLRKTVKDWQTEKLVYFSCEPVYKWLFIWPQMVCSVREPNRNHKDRLIYFFVWSYWKRSIMETKLSPKPVILWFLSAWKSIWWRYDAETNMLSETVFGVQIAIFRYHGK